MSAQQDRPAMSPGPEGTGKPPPAARAPHPAYPQLRVLLADDNEVARSLVQRMLARHAVRADEAHDGEQALQALTERSYDLALLDLSMPRLGGLAVLAGFRAQQHAVRPLLVVIGADPPDGEAFLLEHGIDRVMPKPLRRPALAELLAAASAR